MAFKIWKPCMGNLRKWPFLRGIKKEIPKARIINNQALSLCLNYLYCYKQNQNPKHIYMNTAAQH